MPACSISLHAETCGVPGCWCRDVHKDFKKRGFGFHELQAGLMVCRPCHSAIHRAVPDNKELALHYRTLSDLQQVSLKHWDLQGFHSPCYSVG